MERRKFLKGAAIGATGAASGCTRRCGSVKA